MSDRLSLSQVAALMAYAATRAGGQLLFKTPALRGAGDGPLAERIAGFLLKGYFFVALIPYAALTVLWVWILSFTQLSDFVYFVWAFLHRGMIDGIAGAASMGCHRCLQ